MFKHESIKIEEINEKAHMTYWESFDEFKNWTELVSNIWKNLEEKYEDVSLDMYSYAYTSYDDTFVETDINFEIMRELTEEELSQLEEKKRKDIETEKIKGELLSFDLDTNTVLSILNSPILLEKYLNKELKFD